MYYQQVTNKNNVGSLLTKNTYDLIMIIMKTEREIQMAKTAGNRAFGLQMVKTAENGDYVVYSSINHSDPARAGEIVYFGEEDIWFAQIVHGPELGFTTLGEFTTREQALRHLETEVTFKASF